jgi:hypothetical protein
MDDVASENDDTSIGIDQYVSILELEQENWEVADWQHQDRAGSVSFILDEELP